MWIWTEGLQRCFTQNLRVKTSDLDNLLGGGESVALLKHPMYLTLVVDQEIGRVERQTSWPWLLQYSTVLLFVQRRIVRGARACGPCARFLAHPVWLRHPGPSSHARTTGTVRARSYQIYRLSYQTRFIYKGTLTYITWGIWATPRPPPPRRPCWIDLPWWPLIFPLVSNIKLQYWCHFKCITIPNATQQKIKLVKFSISCRTQEFYKLRKTEKLRRFVLFKIKERKRKSY